MGRVEDSITRKPDISGQRGAFYETFVASLTYGNKMIRKNQYDVISKSDARNIKGLLFNPSAAAMRNYVAETIMPVEYVDMPELEPNMDQVDRLLSAVGQYVPASMDRQRIHIGQTMSVALFTSRIIDNVRQQMPIPNAVQEEGNFINALMIERAGWLTGFKHYDRLRRDRTIHSGMWRNEQLLMREADPDLSWYAPHIAKFRSGMWDAVQLGSILESLPASEGSEQAEAARLREANDALFQETKVLQHYGVKPAVAPALTEGLVREWLIDDPQTEKETLNKVGRSRSKYHSPHLATFHGTSSRFTSSNVPYVGMINSQNPDAGITYLATQNIVEDPNANLLSLQLAPDGNLTTYAGFDVREYLEYAGAGAYEYEQVRAEVLAIYADLVCPAWTYDFVEQDVRKTREAKGESPLQPDEKPRLIEMVLARKRVMKVLKDDIIAERQTELDKHTVDDSADHPHKSMKTHTVTGHRARLRPGFRASPDAQKLAWEEAQVILEPGETWVRKHVRGNLPNPSLGHIVRSHEPSEPRRRASNGSEKASGNGVPFTGEEPIKERVETLVLKPLDRKRNGRRSRTGRSRENRNTREASKVNQTEDKQSDKAGKKVVFEPGQSQNHEAIEQVDVVEFGATDAQVQQQRPDAGEVTQRRNSGVVFDNGDTISALDEPQPEQSDRDGPDNPHELGY